MTQSIRLLNTLAIKLKAGRMAAGALNLASPEVKIHLDSSESSDPIDVEQKELRETNSLVEEFMLLANISVAKKIQETFPHTAVLRGVPNHGGGVSRCADSRWGCVDVIFRHLGRISNSSKIYCRSERGWTWMYPALGLWPLHWINASFVQLIMSLEWPSLITSCSRTRVNQHSTLSCGLWPPGVCYQRNTSAPGVLDGIPLVTMDWPVLFTLISQVPYDDMQVRCPFYVSAV